MTTGIVSMCCIYYCYQVTVCNLMFQCILGIALENLVTLVLQYLVCKICFPSLQTEHTVLYVFITVLFYVAFDTMAYFLLVRKNVRGQVVVEEDWRTFLIYLTVYVFITGMGDVTSLIFHWSKKDGGMFGGIEMFTQSAVPYFCIAVNVIVNLVIVLLQKYDLPYFILTAGKKADPDSSEGKRAAVSFQKRKRRPDQPEMSRSEKTDPGITDGTWGRAGAAF